MVISSASALCGHPLTATNYYYSLLSLQSLLHLTEVVSLLSVNLIFICESAVQGLWPLGYLCDYIWTTAIYPDSRHGAIHAVSLYGAQKSLRGVYFTVIYSQICDIQLLCCQNIFHCC